MLFQVTPQETQNAGLSSEKTEKDTIYILSRKNATQNLNGFSKKQERITMNHVSWSFHIFPMFSPSAYVAEVDHGEIRSGSQLSVPCALVFLEGAMRATVVFFFSWEMMIVNHGHWLVGGLEHGFYDFPFSWEWINHPNWRTHIFQRGRYTTNQWIMVTIWLWLTVRHGKIQHAINR